MIHLKRIYDAPSPDDGFRVLVDRLWPRGVSKERARIDLWLKEVAPSDALRKAFCHEVSRWEEFRKGYRAELEANPAAVQVLLDAARGGTVTLLFGAKDEEHNQAVVLAEYVNERLSA